MAASVLGIRCNVVIRNSLQRLVYCSTHDKSGGQFDTSLLDILVCPLSKEPLRYDKTRNELICDKLKVAYPIINGIPNLIPTDGRLIQEDIK